MKIKIRVNRNHIRKGKPGSETSCPIALSLQSQGFTPLGVDEDNVKFETSEGNQLTAVTPFRAQRFIHTFDNKGKVRPVNFVLTV